MKGCKRINMLIIYDDADRRNFLSEACFWCVCLSTHPNLKYFIDEDMRIYLQTLLETREIL